MDQKIQALSRYDRITIEKILITASPPTQELLDEGYFHRILSLEELFE